MFKNEASITKSQLKSQIEDLNYYPEKEEMLHKQFTSDEKDIGCFCIKNDKPPKDENQIDIYLDRVGYTQFHFNLLFVISIMYFVIGCEFIIINIMLSTLEKEWNLSANQSSFLGSGIFFGIFVTSLLAGYLNNKYGRRVPSIVGCILVTMFSILSCFTHSIWEMFTVKVMIGLGIGIIIPGTTSLLTECIPKSFRSFTLNVIWGLYPIGIIYICYVAIHYIKRNILDWRSVCLCNFLPSLLALFLSLYLKESPRYLILQKRFQEGFKVLNQIGKPKGISLTQEEENKIQDQTLNSLKTSEISGMNSYFEDDFKIITPFLIFLWYSTSLISYGLLYVMPKHFDILTKKDKSDSLKNMMGSMYILFLCPYLRGFISELEFLGRKNTLALGFLGAFFFSICCAIDVNNLSFLAGTLNFFINISLGLVAVYTSEVYPTQLRSGALGIGNAFTRLGGITAPFICNFVDKRIDKGSFYMFAFISLISVFLSCGLTRETRGRELDSNYKSVMKEENTEF